MRNEDYVNILLNRILLTNSYILRKLCKNNDEYEHYINDIEKATKAIEDIYKESGVSEDERT